MTTVQEEIPDRLRADVDAAHALGEGADAADAPLDTDPALDSSGIPWPIFAALRVANGCFMSARGFMSARHVALAGLRLLAFVAAWIAAFVWLPVLPVAIALVGWLAYVAPKVRWVGQQFQHVKT